VQAGGGRTIRTLALGPDDGTPVLWHHGNPGSRVPPVAADVLEDVGVRLITYDRPGGGRSTPSPGRVVADGGRDAQLIADAWGVHRLATAGISGGGAFALATAAALPGRVTAAAVLSGAAPSDAEGLDFTAGMTANNAGAAEEGAREVDRRAALAEMEPVRRAILDDPVAALRGFAEEFSHADRAALDRPDVRDPIAAGMAECLRVSGEGWLDDSLAFARPWGFDVAAIRVHVEIWHGREDTASPFAHARWLAGRVPGAELHELDGGHYAPLLVLPTILGRLAA